MVVQYAPPAWAVVGGEARTLHAVFSDESLAMHFVQVFAHDATLGEMKVEQHQVDVAGSAFRPGIRPFAVSLDRENEVVAVDERPEFRRLYGDGSVLYERVGDAAVVYVWASRPDDAVSQAKNTWRLNRPSLFPEVTTQ